MNRLTFYNPDGTWGLKNGYDIKKVPGELYPALHKLKKYEDRLPEENEAVILTFRNSAGLHVGEATYKKKMFFYVTDTGFGYYEEVYKSPIAWQPLPKPCRKEA